MTSAKRSIASRGKPTRKQEQKALAATLKQLRETHEAQTAIFQFLHSAYKHAVKLYFGKDLPQALVEAMSAAIDAEVREASVAGRDAMLGQVVEKVVAEHLLTEAAGDEALPADAAPAPMDDPDFRDMMAETAAEMEKVLAEDGVGNE